MLRVVAEPYPSSFSEKRLPKPYKEAASFPIGKGGLSYWWYKDTVLNISQG